MLHNMPELDAICKTKLFKYTNFKCVGFVVNNLASCQLGFDLIRCINEFNKARFDVDVCIFCANKELPPLIPTAAIFNNMELNSYYGTIVATDLACWQASLVAPSRDKYLLAYDAKYFPNDPKFVEKINDSGYYIIARSKAHQGFLTQNGYKNVLGQFAPDCDIQNILDIIGDYSLE